MQCVLPANWQKMTYIQLGEEKMESTEEMDKKEKWKRKEKRAGLRSANTSNSGELRGTDAVLLDCIYGNKNSSYKKKNMLCSQHVDNK